MHQNTNRIVLYNASNSFTTLALYKCIYLLTYLHTFYCELFLWLNKIPLSVWA